MPSHWELPTLKDLRPLVLLLVFFATWAERDSLQAIAGAAADTAARLAAVCADPPPADAR